LFRDLCGNDEYLARGFSLGCGRAGIGVFLDDRGDDSVVALEPSRGSALEGGSALYADVAAPDARSAPGAGDSAAGRR
jgi:hypothetical protein